MKSFTEENYLKALFHIANEKSDSDEVGTNELALYLNVKPSSVNSMLKKLKEKGLISYEKYGKISLTEAGSKLGISVIRKHRLWETFLYEKLGFTWDEVHEIAEELEHISSEKLVERLDKFLDYPKFDPHGDPIPDGTGAFCLTYKQTLADMGPGTVCKMVAVKDNSAVFLQYVVGIGLGLNNQIEVLNRNAFDASIVIRVNGAEITVSKKFSENIYVIN